jgi:hypothetical protein
MVAAWGGYLVLQGTCSERPCPVPQPETARRVSAPLPTSESEEEKLREGFLKTKWIHTHFTENHYVKIDKIYTVDHFLENTCASTHEPWGEPGSVRG